MNSTRPNSSAHSSQVGDAILVKAAQSGDSLAFDQIASRHSRRILWKVYRIVGNWQDAEDVLQDSLTKAFLHLNTFEYKASFSTWLTRIAINSALMLLRKRRTHLEISIDGSGDEPGLSEGWTLLDKNANPEQQFAQEQGLRVLRAAVRQLSSGMREVLELQHATGMSLKEIARSLDISVSAAKSRLNQARIRLRASMKPRRGSSRLLDVSYP